jgi:TadE-like protein
MRRCRPERGSASIEFVGFLPVLLVTGLLLIQGAVALYAVTAAATSARHAARAYSLGEDPAGAAQAALPSWLTAQTQTLPGPGHGVRVGVDVPDIVPAMDIRVEREAVMP